MDLCVYQELPQVQELPWDCPPSRPRTSLRSAAPAFTPRSQDSFLGERDEARMYLANFHTRLCEGSCVGQKCVNAHIGESLRRSVYLTEAGNWNYASRMCTNPRCEDALCGFAHTYEERLYHPEVYKVSYCASAEDDNGVCKGFGVHCPFAHNSLEWRGGKYVPPPPPAPEVVTSSSPPTKSSSTSHLPKTHTISFNTAVAVPPPRSEAPAYSVLSQLLRSNQKLAEEHCSLKAELELLKGELQRLKRKTTCPQCHKTDKSVYLLCGHLLCQACSQVPSACPVCAVPSRPLCALKF